MNKTIAIHSYKGGTGKTTISANLAYTLAKEGNNVCIFDLDFKAPSLHTLFKADGRWINDLLNEECDLDDVIRDVSDAYGTKGKLYVGLSDPQTKALSNMSSKAKKWQTNALKQLLDCKKKLYGMGINVVILDTTPGVEYSAINAIATADYVIIVLKPDRNGVEGSTELIRGIYNELRKDGGLVVNQCVNDLDEQPDFSRIGLPVLEHIKCNCDISCKSELVAHTMPEHDFSLAIGRIATMISK